MSRSIRLAITIATLAFAVCGAPHGSRASDRSETARSIVIKAFEFTPRTVMVPAGEAVRWVNMDVANHQITTGVVEGPDRPRPDGRVASPLLFRGDEFSATLRAPGEYWYYCRIHPFMRGSVVVTPGRR